MYNNYLITEDCKFILTNIFTNEKTIFEFKSNQIINNARIDKINNLNYLTLEDGWGGQVEEKFFKKL